MKTQATIIMLAFTSCNPGTITITTGDGDGTSDRPPASTSTSSIAAEGSSSTLADSTAGGSSSSGGDTLNPLDIVVIVDPSLELDAYWHHLSPIMLAIADGAMTVNAHLAVTTPTGAPWNTTCEAPADFLTRNQYYPCEQWGTPYMDAGDDYGLGMVCAGLVPAFDHGPNTSMQTMVAVLMPSPCRGDWRRPWAPLLFVLVTARDDNGSIGSPYVFGQALHEADTGPMSSIYARPCDAVLPNIDEMVLAVNDKAVTIVDLCEPLVDQGSIVSAITVAAGQIGRSDVRSVITAHRPDSVAADTG